MSYEAELRAAHAARRARLAAAAANPKPKQQSKPVFKIIPIGADGRQVLHEPPAPPPPPRRLPPAPSFQDVMYGTERHFRELVNLVSEAYGIGHVLILGPLRDKNLAMPRHVLMYLATTMLGRSTLWVGKVMKRDHTTVLHGRDKIIRLMERDPELRGLVQSIKDRMHEIPTVPLRRQLTVNEMCERASA